MGIIKTIHTEKFEIKLHENGVHENIVRKGELVDVEDVKLLIKANQELANNEYYAALIDAEELGFFTKEAMQYSAKKDSSPKILARAIMVDNLPKKIVGNFYLNITKPKVKTKLFKEREKAMIWLEDQMKLFKLSERVTGIVK